MRDILLVIIVFGSLPLSFIRPSFGILVFSWLSYMNPHRLSWGFAYNFPFAQVVALAVLAGLFFTKEKKEFPKDKIIVVWVLFICWMCISTLFALEPEPASEQLIKALKIQLMVFVALWVICTYEQIISLVWVIALSIGFFGVKGGLYALATGGSGRVWGPPGSFIEGNNELGLALIMTLPLLWFLQLYSKSKIIRAGLLIAIALCVLAILSTQSRGAFIGISVMAIFLWLKSRYKLILGILLNVLGPMAFLSMPDSWHNRMKTIQTYEQDGSAMGRIYAWQFGFTIANKRITGAGPASVEYEKGYILYAPELHRFIVENKGDFRAAHSIYFGVLGQLGWIGLGLFLLLGFMSWRNARWVIKQSAGNEHLKMHGELGSMLQVSLIGYAATGAFLSLEYFDYYYHMLAIIVLLKIDTAQKLSACDDDTVEVLTNVRKAR